MHARKSPHCVRNTHSPDTVCAPTLGVHRNRPRARETNMTQSEPLIPARPSVAIIGDGFGGLAAAHYLTQAGIASFTNYEKARSEERRVGQAGGSRVRSRVEQYKSK